MTVVLVIKDCFHFAKRHSVEILASGSRRGRRGNSLILCVLDAVVSMRTPPSEPATSSFLEVFGQRVFAQKLLVTCAAPQIVFHL